MLLTLALTCRVALQSRHAGSRPTWPRRYSASPSRTWTFQGSPSCAASRKSLVVLVVSALFIVLTADIDRAVLGQLGLGVLLLTAAMVVVVRPIAILIATIGSGLSWQERLLSGWIAPRGIVAAAMAGVAGLRLQNAGYPGTELVMPAVFALIAATMLLHGFSLEPLARRLGLHLGEGDGVLIVGASSWATDLASALHQAGVNVTLADTYPGALREARRRKLAVLQVELLSRHGEEAIQERPIDYLIAATQDDIYNGLVCARLAPELGRERVFQVAPTRGAPDPHTGLTRDLRGKVFADEGLDFPTLEQMQRAGAVIAIETIQNEQAATDPLGSGGGALAVVRRNGDLHIISPENAAPLSGEPGDRLLTIRVPGSFDSVGENEFRPIIPRTARRGRERARVVMTSRIVLASAAGEQERSIRCAFV